MASRARTLGVIGAFFLLAGPCVVGAGFLNAAYSLYTTSQCTAQCGVGHSAFDAQLESELLLGVGIAVAGVGLGLVLAATVPFVGRPIPSSLPIVSTERSFDTGGSPPAGPAS